MKQMRSIALTAIAALALATGVSACGSSSDDDGGSGSSTAASTTGGGAASFRGETVRLWIMNNGPDPVGDTERIVRPFEDRTGVDVEVELVGWDVQFDRIRNAAASGRGPDVTQAGTTQVPFFAALGGFDDLGDKVEAIGGESGYAPGIWETSQVVGQEGTWGIPWFTEARTVYYRRDVLEKAGVDPATAFQDWDSFRATLEAIKARVPEIDGQRIEPFGMPGKKAFDLVHNVMPFVWSAGGSELNDDATRSAINTPEAQEGVEFFADLVADGLADRSMLERDGTQVENQFKGGRLGVWIGGVWVLPSAAREDDDNWVPAARRNVAVAPMPRGPSGEDYTFVGGSNLMLFKNSEHKEAAWALIDYLSQDRVQSDYADLMGMFPARLAAQQARGESSPENGAFFEAIEAGRSYAAIPQWGQIENAYKTRFGTILDMAAGQGGDYTPEAVRKQLDDAAAEADGLLAQSAG